jgi:UPF0716 protein FxsA
MRLVFLLLFIAAPLLELAVLIWVGKAIGVFATLAIVIGSAILGMFVVRLQGFSVFNRMRETVAEGQPPVLPMTEGALLLLAGILLILPGLIGDTIGLLLLVPPLRQLAATWMIRRSAVDVSVYTRNPWNRTSEKQKPENSKSGPVIEGEYTRVDEPGKDRNDR